MERIIATYYIETPFAPENAAEVLAYEQSSGTFVAEYYAYYVNEPRRDDDLKAIGPFIKACAEMKLLNKQK